MKECGDSCMRRKSKAYSGTWNDMDYLHFVRLILRTLPFTNIAYIHDPGSIQVVLYVYLE